MVILGVLVLAVAVMVGYILLEAIGSDDTLALEETVREVLDDNYEKDSLPSWCVGGCSATDDEWHTPDNALLVAEALVGALTDMGLDAVYETGPPDAYIVKVAEGVGLDIAITGVGWSNASSDATGTAIWFTSVALFDQPEESVSATTGLGRVAEQALRLL